MNKMQFNQRMTRLDAFLLHDEVGIDALRWQNGDYAASFTSGRSGGFESEQLFFFYP